MVANRASAYVHVTAIKKWDICAGNAIANELGGRQTTLLGDEIDYSNSGNPKNLDGLLVTLKDHDKFLKAIQPEFVKMQKEQANHRVAKRET